MTRLCISSPGFGGHQARQWIRSWQCFEGKCHPVVASTAACERPQNQRYRSVPQPAWGKEVQLTMDVKGEPTYKFLLADGVSTLKVAGRMQV